MSIFKNVSFVNEGEQTEEYKARKAKEAEDKKKAEAEREKRRYKETGLGPGNRFNGTNDYDRRIKTLDVANNEHESRARAGYNKEYKNFTNNTHGALDAINRHIRRHPDQYKESTIFESVQFLND